jgi:ATP-dependent DNA helicase RecQ
MVFAIDKFTLLKQYFGHNKFRPGQEELVDALLSGRDVLGVMPTGAGKSICYQLPALLLPGLTLVISPLISLMKDQVTALSQTGISSAYINSSLTSDQYREVFRRIKNGVYKIIYVAPERLTTQDFLQFAGETEISLLAVDEAHCVSQWGQDFRPSYLKIAEFVGSLSKRPVVGAFTATATTVVKADINKLLLLQDPLRITTGFDRPNLYFEVVRPKSKYAYLQALLAGRPGQSGIVYCATRKTVESVCDNLRQNGISATRYHAGLEDVERKETQEDFVYDRSRVMVATNAFGMGIDKSNVSFVVHYNMPKNIESYYQEAGRAGRDGEKAHCVLLFSAGDIQTAKFFINNTEGKEVLSEDERELVRKKDLQRLDQMAAYCKTTGCLRTYLLNYFGENAETNCGNCCNCIGEMVRQDITVEAQKILSAVVRVEKKHTSGLGLTLIIRMLHGSKEQRVIQLGLDKLPTYGIMHDTDRTQIRDYIDFLIREGYLTLTGDEYPVLRMTEQAKQVLFHGEKVLYTWRKQSRAEKAVPSRKGSKAAPAQADEGLFATLKALRTKLAQEEKVPAYIIFSNAALADMVVKQPRSLAQFLQVTGVGEVKAARYGQAFLEEIHNWIRETGHE